MDKYGGTFKSKPKRITYLFNAVKKNIVASMKYETDPLFREKQKKSAKESNRNSLLAGLHLSSMRDLASRDEYV
ncbi:Hypothetical predicted protein [Cloeon dipterum]|uniref:Uncharacterized protein n=1 Tax=Cloeon dipterum TaxID=197152 RepID=A0A8S1DX95_9INSE|nr:Hypothetical predicted protein [Cloeon dipterum]